MYFQTQMGEYFSNNTTTAKDLYRSSLQCYTIPWCSISRRCWHTVGRCPCTTVQKMGEFPKRNRWGGLRSLRRHICSWGALWRRRIGSRPTGRSAWGWLPPAACTSAGEGSRRSKKAWAVESGFSFISRKLVVLWTYKLLSLGLKCPCPRNTPV